MYKDFQAGSFLGSFRDPYTSLAIKALLVKMGQDKLYEKVLNIHDSSNAKASKSSSQISNEPNLSDAINYRADA